MLRKEDMGTVDLVAYSWAVAGQVDPAIGVIEYQHRLSTPQIKLYPRAMDIVQDQDRTHNWGVLATMQRRPLVASSRLGH